MDFCDSGITGHHGGAQHCHGTWRGHLISTLRDIHEVAGKNIEPVGITGDTDTGGQHGVGVTWPMKP